MQHKNAVETDADTHFVNGEVLPALRLVPSERGEVPSGLESMVENIIFRYYNVVIPYFLSVNAEETVETSEEFQ